QRPASLRATPPRSSKPGTSSDICCRAWRFPPHVARFRLLTASPRRSLLRMRYDALAPSSLTRTTLTRSQALANAREYFDSGALHADLARRVAYRTESQEEASGPVLRNYLADEIAPSVMRHGFVARLVDNPVAGHGPMLVASRHEAGELPTVFVYGHGDVVRGYDEQWRKPLGPWSVTVEGDRWYGRGTADNN